MGLMTKSQRQVALPLSEATEKFVADGAPFKALQRFSTPLVLSGYVVRSRIGEDVALCDSPDAAEAIAEVLNAVSHRGRS